MFLQHGWLAPNTSSCGPASRVTSTTISAGTTSGAERAGARTLRHRASTTHETTGKHAFQRRHARRLVGDTDIDSSATSSTPIEAGCAEPRDGRRRRAGASSAVCDESTCSPRNPRKSPVAVRRRVIQKIQVGIETSIENLYSHDRPWQVSNCEFGCHRGSVHRQHQQRPWFHCIGCIVLIRLSRAKPVKSRRFSNDVEVRARRSQLTTFEKIHYVTLRNRNVTMQAITQRISLADRSVNIMDCGRTAPGTSGRCATTVLDMIRQCSNSIPGICHVGNSRLYSLFRSGKNRIDGDSAALAWTEGSEKAMENASEPVAAWRQQPLRRGAQRPSIGCSSRLDWTTPASTPCESSGHRLESGVPTSASVTNTRHHVSTSPPRDHQQRNDRPER